MRIVFMGTPAFAARSLRALLDARLRVVGVVSQPARRAGRGRQPTQPAVAALAIERGIPLIQPHRPHEPDALETLRRWAPDVIAVAAYGCILRRPILEMPPHGCVNVHASLLPRHRGACPIPMSIVAGDAVTGVTIMLMDEGMDTGPILAQRELPILDEDTSASLTEKLADLGAGLLVETLPRWVDGEIEPRAQDDGYATSTGMLCKADGRIDWRESARQIWLKVRAFQPWPSTYSDWDGKMLKILAARPAGHEELSTVERPVSSSEWEPGRVILVGEEPGVVTGHGVLLLSRVQLAGKAPTEGKAFVRGQRGFVGSRLGG